MSLVVVDYGAGNTGSVVNMCRRIGAEPVVTSVPEVIDRSTKLLLPGVGAFDPAIDSLRGSGALEALLRRIAQGVITLGICLGMQLLFEGSEEGTKPGLSLIPGFVKRLPARTEIGEVSIPHMGWSPLRTTRSHPLIAGLSEDARFYFVHSYAAVPEVEADVLSLSAHGDDFVSVVAHENVLGVQFHPEKSHRHGKSLLRNFIEMG